MTRPGSYTVHHTLILHEPLCLDNPSYLYTRDPTMSTTSSPVLVTHSQSKSTTSLAIPLDIIFMIAQLLSHDTHTDTARTNSRRALAALVRVNRDIYEVVMPHLYQEVGVTMRQFNQLFEAAEICKKGAYTPRNSGLIVYWPFRDRFLRRLSLIKVIHFRPRLDETESDRQLFRSRTKLLKEH